MFQCGYLEGLRSSLGGWTQKVKSWYWGRPLVSGPASCRPKDQRTVLAHSSNICTISTKKILNFSLEILAFKTKRLLGVIETFIHRIIYIFTFLLLHFISMLISPNSFSYIISFISLKVASAPRRLNFS